MSDTKQMDAGIAPAEYDLVIVGAGISGALVAKFFALADTTHKVLILEAGDELKPNINDALERYYESAMKVPESPYTPAIFTATHKDRSDRIQQFTEGQRSDAVLSNPASINAGRPTVLSLSVRAWQVPHKAQWWNGEQQKKCDPKNLDVNYLDQADSPLPFASTYERIAGGTARHWMGISLRHLRNDFRMGQQYHQFKGQNGDLSNWPNWPVSYEDMDPWYARAENEIGVSGDAQVQKHLEESIGFKDGNLHGYPMAPIPMSYSDKMLNQALQDGQQVTFPARDGKKLRLVLTPLPVARNSEPFNRRRACAGNSSCIPICPIQAKYDPTITLREACNTGRVQVIYRAVACNVATVAEGQGRTVNQIEYIKYDKDVGGGSERHTVRAKTYVLAGNAIEIPRLILMSNGGKGAVSPDLPVGRYLMDHPFFIASAQATTQGFPYRGPLVTSGIEMLRDGEFRQHQASFRVDVSNSGWSLTSNGSAQAIAEDFITGHNNSGQNPGGKVQGGVHLMNALNSLLTRQVSLGFLVEQTPDWCNRVSLSDKVDGLGLPRPRIEYNFSHYTKDGLAEAAALARNIFAATGYVEYADQPGPGVPSPPPDACQFDWTDAESGQPLKIRYMGAGHIAGTCRMGAKDDKQAVVDPDLKVQGVDNLYVIGSAVFPTLGTANPTLTIAALALRLADHLAIAFKSAGGQPV